MSEEPDYFFGISIMVDKTVNPDLFDYLKNQLDNNIVFYGGNDDLLNTIGVKLYNCTFDVDGFKVKNNIKLLAKPYEGDDGLLHAPERFKFLTPRYTNGCVILKNLGAKIDHSKVNQVSIINIKTNLEKKLKEVNRELIRKNL